MLCMMQDQTIVGTYRTDRQFRNGDKISIMDADRTFGWFDANDYELTPVKQTTRGTELALISVKDILVSSKISINTLEARYGIYGFSTNTKDTSYIRQIMASVTSVGAYLPLIEDLDTRISCLRDEYDREIIFRAVASCMMLSVDEYEIIFDRNEFTPI